MDKVTLKEWVGDGKLEQAFTAMLDYGKSRKAVAWYNALLIQYNQFKELEQDELEGVLSDDEENLARNRILSATLALIDDLPAGERTEAPYEPLAAKGGKARWPLWALVSAVALIGLYFGYSRLDLAAARSPSMETGGARALHFPEGNSLTFISTAGDEIKYSLLKGELTDLGGGTRQVSFSIRCATRDGYGANFWDDSFRLELDGGADLLAPNSGLNELVAKNSFKDGTVSFAVNGSFSNMKLVVINPWNKEEMRKLAIGS